MRNISGVFMKIDGILFYRPHAANTAYVLYFVDTNANQTTIHWGPFFVVIGMAQKTF